MQCCAHMLRPHDPHEEEEEGVRYNFWRPFPSALHYCTFKTRDKKEIADAVVVELDLTHSRLSRKKKSRFPLDLFLSSIRPDIWWSFLAVQVLFQLAIAAHREEECVCPNAGGSHYWSSGESQREKRGGVLKFFICMGIAHTISISDSPPPGNEICPTRRSDKKKKEKIQK